MKNETKNEKANIGEAKPKFQQTEPVEIDEADLKLVAGGAGATSAPSCPCD